MEARGTDAAPNQVCDATVLGDVQVHHNAAPIQIGSSSLSSCGGNVVVSNLEVHNNTGSTSIIGNVVDGNLHDHDNSGPTELFDNTVTQDLQCENNTAITGGMNSADQKQGQCVAF